MDWDIHLLINDKNSRLSSAIFFDRKCIFLLDLIKEVISVATTPNEYINIYKGTVTKGAQDGTLVSQNDIQTDPLEVELDATNNEVKYIKCAIRTQSGYKSSRTSISFVGQTRDKWQIAKDENFKDAEDAKKNGAFKSTLVIADEVNDTNTIFWVKVSSSNDERPRRDISVSFKIDTYIVTV